MHGRQGENATQDSGRPPASGGTAAATGPRCGFAQRATLSHQRTPPFRPPKPAGSKDGARISEHPDRFQRVQIPMPSGNLYHPMIRPTNSNAEPIEQPRRSDRSPIHTLEPQLRPEMPKVPPLDTFVSNTTQQLVSGVRATDLWECGLIVQSHTHPSPECRRDSSIPQAPTTHDPRKNQYTDQRRSHESGPTHWQPEVRLVTPRDPLPIEIIHFPSAFTNQPERLEHEWWAMNANAPLCKRDTCEGITPTTQLEWYLATHKLPPNLTRAGFRVFRPQPHPHFPPRHVRQQDMPTQRPPGQHTLQQQQQHPNWRGGKYRRRNNQRKRKKKARTMWRPRTTQPGPDKGDVVPDIGPGTSIRSEEPPSHDLDDNILPSSSPERGPAPNETCPPPGHAQNGGCLVPPDTKRDAPRGTTPRVRDDNTTVTSTVTATPNPSRASFTWDLPDCQQPTINTEARSDKRIAPQSSASSRGAPTPSATSHSTFGDFDSPNHRGPSCNNRSPPLRYYTVQRTPSTAPCNRNTMQTPGSDPMCARRLFASIPHFRQKSATIIPNEIETDTIPGGTFQPTPMDQSLLACTPAIADLGIPQTVKPQPQIKDTRLSNPSTEARESATFTFTGTQGDTTTGPRKEPVCGRVGNPCSGSVSAAEDPPPTASGNAEKPSIGPLEAMEAKHTYSAPGDIDAHLTQQAAADVRPSPEPSRFCCDPLHVPTPEQDVAAHDSFDHSRQHNLRANSFSEGHASGDNAPDPNDKGETDSIQFRLSTLLSKDGSSVVRSEPNSPHMEASKDTTWSFPASESEPKGTPPDDQTLSKRDGKSTDGVRLSPPHSPLTQSSSTNSTSSSVRSILGLAP